MLTRRCQSWVVCVAWWISWRFHIDLDTRTVVVLVVQASVLAVSWLCPSGRLGLPMFLCRANQYFIVHWIIDDLCEAWRK